MTGEQSHTIVHVGGAESAPVRMLCLPHAGGGAAAFNPWRDLFPRDVRVDAVRLPGRESRVREQPITLFAAMFEMLLAEVEACVDPKETLILFGQCVGALSAYSLAEELERRGRVVAHLCVSGRGPPWPVAAEDRISRLPRDEFVQVLMGLGGMPTAILKNDEFMELLLPAIRADYAVSESFSGFKKVQLRCPILAFVASSDQIVLSDTCRGWRDFTKGKFEVVVYEGTGHVPTPEELRTIGYEISARLWPL